ncbi:hypothetical protein LJC05_03475 [Bacteroides sp. OttesenSCG-928-J23]|nr:hypothetical protein [Bacteroides sp. OttesenSCG-928-N06]MDL2247772.1 hypothetical protein [Bacteroides sp. OttesenSCG-928-J23]MDL2306006.1 hypothetical protein [Bacteroides sp. OttesenSCG-928-D19]
MKDILLTGKRQKTELITLLICFLIANLANLYSIVAYNTSYMELLTSIGYVAVAAVALYIIWTVLRLLVYAIAYLFRKKKV